MLAALCLCVAVLYLLQMLLMPKYMDESRDGALIAEYYDNTGNNDVIFIGDCEVYENISPITLWEDYGITSYIRGSPQQMIWQSYYLMEETFRYETPKVVVFNVLSMKYHTPASAGSSDQREAYNRMTLDGMRWSSSKWNSILASMTETEKQWQSIFTYLFPILRYHSRWSELKQDDFTYLFQKEQIGHNGYLMQTGIKPVTAPHMEKPLVDYTFGENSYYYLDKMVALCEEYGVELVLMKAPSLYPVWWDQWDAQMESYAQEHGLKYINFLELVDEIGIDWNTDTYDTGLHLNVYGAEKLASYFGKILSEECGIPDRRGEEAISTLWEEKTQAYYDQKQALESAEQQQGE
ncbi:MAG: SGNH/GDSL hydrolase family protein [Oscillospiraceae bacterium]|nr:SGNH/GDSL hydrolase family protein [Oscillospiraceae bacterium]